MRMLPKKNAMILTLDLTKLQRNCKNVSEPTKRRERQYAIPSLNGVFKNFEKLKTNIFKQDYIKIKSSTYYFNIILEGLTNELNIY